MSVPVALDRLKDEAQRFGSSPYLLTVSADGRAHAVSVSVSWNGDELVMAAGRRTVANATDRPLVSLLWPPYEAGGYSLIVDGEAHVSTGPDGAGIAVTPTTAVLHRSAAALTGDGSAAGNDCIPLIAS